MEPEALEFAEKAGFSPSFAPVGIMSIAISLKRIADALSVQPGALNFFDYIKDASEAIQSNNR